MWTSDHRLPEIAVNVSLALVYAHRLAHHFVAN